MGDEDLLRPFEETLRDAGGMKAVDNVGDVYFGSRCSPSLSSLRIIISPTCAQLLKREEALFQINNLQHLGFKKLEMAPQGEEDIRADEKEIGAVERAARARAEFEIGDRWKTYQGTNEERDTKPWLPPT